jgi:hypothetical protein
MLMRTERMIVWIAAALVLALSAGATLAQQTPQGTQPPGTDAGPQRPDPSAIPEKFGPPIDAKRPNRPDEQSGQGSSDAQPPHNRGLDLQTTPPDPKTLSEPPARPPQ